MTTLQTGKNCTNLINKSWYNICYVPILYKVVFVLKSQIDQSCLSKTVNL